MYISESALAPISHLIVSLYGLLICYRANASGNNITKKKLYKRCHFRDAIAKYMIHGCDTTQTSSEQPTLYIPIERLPLLHLPSYLA